MTEIVAEISGNHGGSLRNALRLIETAAEAGADAVKFQCFEPERLATRRVWRPEVWALSGGVPLVDLYRKTHTPKEWFPILIDYAEFYDLKWFSSAFDPKDVAFLETLDCPRYKISAFEMLDWDIIKAIKETGKPIVLSVRPRCGLTILEATQYEGIHWNTETELGLSAHGKRAPFPGAPMVEYHLRLNDVETPDASFSLRMAELQEMVRIIRG